MLSSFRTTIGIKAIVRRVRQIVVVRMEITKLWEVHMEITVPCPCAKFSWHEVSVRVVNCLAWVPWEAWQIWAVRSLRGLLASNTEDSSGHAKLFSLVKVSTSWDPLGVGACFLVAGGQVAVICCRAWYVKQHGLANWICVARKILAWVISSLGREFFFEKILVAVRWLGGRDRVKNLGID